MMRIVIATGLLLLAGFSARAQGQGGEQLFLIPPPDWTVVVHETKGAVELTELTPPNQTAQAWTDKLKVELIQGKPMADAQATMKARLEALAQDCADIGAGQMQLAVENGYDTGVRAVACPKTKGDGHGEIGLYKVILGKERAYLVGRMWSGKPFEKDKMPLNDKTTEDWLAFMNKVVVCDPRERTHPCPQTK